MDTNIEAGFVPNRGNCMVRDQVLYQQRQLYGYTGTNQVPIEETEWIYFTGTRFQQRKLIGTRTLFQTEEAIRTGSDIVPIEETVRQLRWFLLLYKPLQQPFALTQLKVLTLFMLSCYTIPHLLLHKPPYKLPPENIF